MRSSSLSDLLKFNRGIIPFTYEQAKNIAEKHQYLIGRSYNNDLISTTVINMVEISPYYNTDLYDYIDHFKATGEFIIGEAVKEKRMFDVLVLADIKQPYPKLIFKDIRTYAHEQDFDLNPDNFI